MWSLMYISFVTPWITILFWEANTCSVDQEIPRLVQNPKVHYHIVKYPSLYLVLTQMNPLHIITTHFLRLILVLSSYISLNFLISLIRSDWSTRILYTFLAQQISWSLNVYDSCLPTFRKWWNHQTAVFFGWNIFESTSYHLTKWKFCMFNELPNMAI